MTKLKKCQNCNKYTLKETCDNCNTKTKDAHYKFIKIKDAPKSDGDYFDKKRLKSNLNN